MMKMSRLYSKRKNDMGSKLSILIIFCAMFSLTIRQCRASTAMAEEKKAEEVEVLEPISVNEVAKQYAKVMKKWSKLTPSERTKVLGKLTGKELIVGAETSFSGECNGTGEGKARIVLKRKMIEDAVSLCVIIRITTTKTYHINDKVKTKGTATDFKMAHGEWGVSLTFYIEEK